MRLTDHQLAQARPYVPDIDGMIQADDLDSLLDALDDAMLNSLDEDEEPTSETGAISRLYDDIIALNKK